MEFRVSDQQKSGVGSACSSLTAQGLGSGRFLDKSLP